MAHTVEEAAQRLRHLRLAQTSGRDHQKDEEALCGKSNFGGVHAPPPEDGGTISMIREKCACWALAFISRRRCLRQLRMGTRKPSLKDCHGFCEPAFAGEAGRLQHVDVRLCVHGFGPVVE